MICMSNANTEAWLSIIDRVSDHEIRKGIHSFVNPFSMLMLEKDPAVASLIDFWYADGISLVNTINTTFGKSCRRFSFDETSLAPIVFAWAKDNNKRVAVIGTKAESIIIAVK